MCGQDQPLRQPALRRADSVATRSVAQFDRQSDPAPVRQPPAMDCLGGWRGARHASSAGRVRRAGTDAEVGSDRKADAGRRRGPTDARAVAPPSLRERTIQGFAITGWARFSTRFRTSTATRRKSSATRGCNWATRTSSIGSRKHPNREPVDEMTGRAPSVSASSRSAHDGAVTQASVGRQPDGALRFLSARRECRNEKYEE